MQSVNLSYSVGKFGKRTAWGGQIVGQNGDNISRKDEIIPFLQASSTFRSVDSIGMISNKLNKIFLEKFNNKIENIFISK